MNLKKVMDIYDIIKSRIPKTYPRPTLAFYENEQTLSKNVKFKLNKDENLYAVCDPDTNTIIMPMNMTFVSEHTNKIKNIPLNKMSDEEIAETLLHELAHLYAGIRFGYESKQYNDESYCDGFARRWIKLLKKEKLI